MQPLFDWLTSLPPAALYLALAGASAIENFFPPFPADTVVAFGSFIAARGHASVVGSFLATWLGNIAGAMAMYALGRRYGAERLTRRLVKGDGGAQARLEALYGRHGLWALCVSRFLPGVRALVPPFAGALRIPPARTAVAVTVASGIWYGAITYLAFTVGARWEVLAARVGAVGRWAGIVALVVALIAAAMWLVRRRRT